MSLRILVTGAGSGLGRAIALHYAARGARVACTDRDAASVAETLAHVEKEGGSGLAFALDVTREEDFVAARERLQSEWGGLDLLVNNAGVATAGSIEEAPLSDWDWVLNINLLGVVRGCKTFAPLFKAQKSGYVVNIASFAGIANPPAMASYNVAKAGVISLSETLLHELAPFGIGVSVVCPAFFPTNLMNAARVTQPGTVAMVHKFMKKSGITADDVAAQIASAVDKRQFLVLTHKDTRVQALVKRASPQTFFRMMQKTTAKWGRKKS
ncbi:SDR family oxidoreductase [Stagnimonas aquatica]|uniref:SDR family oxidoreductase n=1 Tax=Stagnimonas aquatica TaxID=2689987 RepID=A0A3N0VM92_9GAMM|nr:SDR family oxidoreductase [Stagnimonas aquatica]ROH93851.1 SDR family oxidoreductase [Stagnimonas aquatica]